MLLTISLWLFATTTVSGLFVCLDLNTEGRSWRNFRQVFGIIGTILLIVVIVLSSEGSSEDYRAKEQLKEQQWKATGIAFNKVHNIKPETLQATIETK